jgi:hypothetical protein
MGQIPKRQTSRSHYGSKAPAILKQLHKIVLNYVTLLYVFLSNDIPFD